MGGLGGGGAFNGPHNRQQEEEEKVKAAEVEDGRMRGRVRVPFSDSGFQIPWMGMCNLADCGNLLIV